MGVRGMNLSDTDEVIGMQVESEGDNILIVSEKGLGKCTPTTDFKVQHRGGKGLKCYKITDKTGYVVGMKTISPEDEIMMITTEGIIIRMKTNSISVIGRNTSGVKLINLSDEDTKVASVSKVNLQEFQEEDEEATDPVPDAEE